MTRANEVSAATRRDAFLATQTVKDNADLFFHRILLARLATDVPNGLLGRYFPCLTGKLAETGSLETACTASLRGSCGWQATDAKGHQDRALIDGQG